MNSKKISDLSELKSDNLDGDLKFVTERKGVNNKVSFETIQKKIYNDANIDTFSPDSLNAFISISEKDKSKPLAAKGGVLLNQALSNKLSISGSSTSVSTPITFTSKVKVNNPSENSDAVNLQYLKSYVQSNKLPSLFGDFSTKQFIYGNEILTTIGKPLSFDKSDPNNWVVTGVIAESKRTNQTGWQKIKNLLTLTTSIDKFKKIIMIFADEDGDKVDADTQLFPYELDVSEYIYFCEQYKKRLEIYNKISSSTSATKPVSIDVCGQKITWKSNIRTKNSNDYVYFGPNYYWVYNGSDQTRAVALKYVQNYTTQIQGTHSYFLVAVIGLK